MGASEIRRLPFLCKKRKQTGNFSDKMVFFLFLQGRNYLFMKHFIAIMLSIFALSLQAQVRIGENEALTTASHFLESQTKQQAPTVSLSEVIYSKQTGLPNLYVFSASPKGFVIISALDEVLAYSLTSEMPAQENLPEHIAYWLDLYNTSTDYLVTHPEERRIISKGNREVAPLLTSIWGQGCYHNNLCPVISNGPCGHASAGCVAIAMAQIMYYHKQPLHGTGSLSYYVPNHGSLSADFEHTTYDWEHMVDTLHDYNIPIALLVLHCGISVRMMYGAHLSLASSTDAAEAFRQYFNYFFSSYLLRKDIDDEDWITLIKGDLDTGHPIYYSGSTNLNGHAFVCDGYDSNDLFHFNFGWDGVADGYYSIDDPYGFSNGQGIICNLFPVSEFNINPDEHNIIYVSPDGDGDGSSWEQATSDLQMAIIRAQMDDCSIWVKEGIHKGMYWFDYAFRIQQGCKLYGGFKGDEPYDYDLSLRDLDAHPTILDGEHTQGVIELMPNSTNKNVFIDGFTIRNGYSQRGGGLMLRNNCSIKNCKICFNQAPTIGGGVISHSNSDSVQFHFEDCEFFGNEANSGGAVYDFGNATYLRCRFHDNTAVRGGAIYCKSDKNPSDFVNCTIDHNVAENGGGIACASSNACFWSCLINNNSALIGGGCHINGMTSFYNCTVVKNESQSDYGGMFVSLSSPNHLTNSIVWGNVSQNGTAQVGPLESYSNCAIQGIVPKSLTNFNAEAENDGEEPGFYVRFVDADVEAGVGGEGGNWRLQSNSPCIDRSYQIMDQPLTDLDGQPRMAHAKQDFGAYESNTVAHTIESCLCESDSVYYYDGELLTEFGVYTFSYPSEPYDSLVVVLLREYVNFLETEEVICGTDSFEFFGTLLHEPGHYSAITNCTLYELNLDFKPLERADCLNVEICEGETYNFFGSVLSEAGNYTDTIDCTIHELNLSIKPETIIPMEETICEGDSYNFHGRILKKEGHYESIIDCTKHYILDLNVTPYPPLRCSNDTIVEYARPIQLSAFGAESYVWSTGDTTQVINVVPMSDKVYSVTGYSEKGCGKTVSVRVQVQNEMDDVILYPNPARDKAHVFLPYIDEVEVFNLLGVRIEHIQAHRNPVELDLSHYDNGIYIVCVKQLNNSFYKKFIVQH